MQFFLSGEIAFLLIKALWKIVFYWENEGLFSNEKSRNQKKNKEIEI